MFATDRDLLVLEPRLFFDVSWTAQSLVSSPSGGAIDSSGEVLTLSGAGFDALGVEAGHVVIAGSAPLEVVERLGSTSLRVSRLRATASGPVIPAAPGSGLKVVIHTFRPQIALVHDQVIRALGIEPGSPEEGDITNPGAFRLAEALGALHLVFSSAAALVGDDSPMWARARIYADRYREHRARLVAEIDLNADGHPDTVRRVASVPFVRG